MLKTKPHAELLTTSEAGAIYELPCSAENIRRLVRVGRLRPAIVVGRGQMLFDRDDVLRLAEERRSHRG